MRNRVIYLALAILAVLVFAGAQKNPRDKQPRLPSAASVSPEHNKEVARRVFDDLFTRGRYEVVDQIYDRDCQVHFGNRSEALSQAVEEGKGWRSAAPDLVMKADHITVDGDMVNVSWSARGTHTGAGHGLKPTGKHILVRGSSRFRMVNGKIVEAWNSEYRDELFRQLGVSKNAAFLYEKAQDLEAALHRLLVEPFAGSGQ